MVSLGSIGFTARLASSQPRSSTRLTLRHDLRQKPGTALSLVNPDLDQTGRGDVVVLFTYLVRRTHASRQIQIVRAKLSQHVLRRHVLLVVVLQPLMLRDVADGPESSSAEFACPLGDIVRHREDLSTLIIEQQMVIAEMRAAHVPVEILRLEVESEHVGEHLAQLGGNLYDGIAAQVCWGLQNSLLFHGPGSF